MGKASKKSRQAKSPTDERKDITNLKNQPPKQAIISPEFPAIRRKEFVQPECLLGEDIFTVDGVLSVGECREFISFAEALGFDHQGSLGAAGGEAFRDNDRTSITSSSLASTLWEQTGLNRLFSMMTIGGKKACGLNPNIRFYRYVPGQKFMRHIDESVQISPHETTLFTLLIYLSGSFPQVSKPMKRGKGEPVLVGGETVFYGNRNRVVSCVVPTIGKALLHLHGDKCLEHEAREVEKGVKYVLRSDVVFST